MSTESIDLILAEVKQLSERMEARFDKQDTDLDVAGQQITVLAVNMKELLGNGQPGRIQRLEDSQRQLQSDHGARLGALERYNSLWTGKQSVVAAGIAALISMVGIALHGRIAEFIKLLLK